MMVEVEEIELDLALSIGGSFGKHTVEESADDSKRETSSFVSNSDGANGIHEKREMQALRRMEAKKKREEKRERVREPEQEWERGFKREKTECHNDNGAWMMTTTMPFRVQQFATVQYLPSNNGFPSLCWVGNENNVGGVYAVNSGDRKPKSNGSSRCSSVVSDYQNSSREDGGSTDSHSHSVQSLVELPQFNTTKETSIRTQPEESASASSYPMRPKQDNNNTTKDTEHIVKDTQPKPNLTSSLHPLIKQQSLKTTNIALPIPTDTPLSSSNSNNTNPPSMETKVEMMGKPPKPLSQTSLLQMPYVSTKGNNGKTVNGFLYRYTKSEVSIVCVCHGSTFSPAEFVQHAGGTDTSHPLRHITVIPSAFA